MADSSSVAFTGCWGRAPKPPTAPDREGSQHGRRKSLSGLWWGRGAADAPAPAEGGEPADDRNLADALAGLQLDEQQQQAAAKAPAGKAAPPAAGPSHRRRWSFGRQVAPLPEPSLAEAEAAGSPAEDDLLATSSGDLSFSSRRGSPSHARRQDAKQQQQQQQPAPPPGLTPRPSPGWAAGDEGGSPSSSAGTEPEVPTPPRGQGGYRRLWHSISSVRKGDPLPAAAAAPCGDVTVDSLVRAVQVRAVCAAAG